MFLTHDKDGLTESSNRSKGEKREPQMLDDEIVDSFGPSRLPTWVLFPPTGARQAVGGEIKDLLTPHGEEPPAMVVEALGGSRFRNFPRIFPTLVVKRESAGLYKGVLCARGEFSAFDSQIIYIEPHGSPLRSENHVYFGRFVSI